MCRSFRLRAGAAACVLASALMASAFAQQYPSKPIRIDFAPLGMIADVPTALVVHPSIPAKNMNELIAIAKAKPGVLNYKVAREAGIQPE